MTRVLDDEAPSKTRLGLQLYGHLVIDDSGIAENISNDTFVHRLWTKHSLLIFNI